MLDLEGVLTDLLTERLEDGAEKISFADAARIDRQIRDYLAISDSPWGREPYDIADFICHSCGSASKDAAERWLQSISDEQRANLGLVDVLMLLQPGLEEDINALADENEDERNGAAEDNEAEGRGE